MLIVKHKIDPSTLPQIKLKENELIFDIETTGFSAKYAYIYMIGMLYYNLKENHFVLEQWFREKASDEYEILYNFNQLLSKTDTVYSFNGDQFDLPFIAKRMGLYKLQLVDVKSTDMLKLMRPFKHTLGLDNMKLKTIEAYWGYKREDPFSGGDLIQLYTSYLDTQEDPLLKTLLLHNYEDLLGLGQLISHLPFVTMLGHFKDELISIDLVESTIENGLYRGEFIVPVSSDATLTTDLYTLVLSANRASLTMPTEVNHLKLYFDTPSDYYYLPNEDYAVHKSIGKFVSKDHRIKATKETCYVKKEDFFLPGYRHFELPLNLYYKQTKDPVGYFSVQDLVESDLFNTYIAKLLRLL